MRKKTKRLIVLAVVSTVIIASAAAGVLLALAGLWRACDSAPRPETTATPRGATIQSRPQAKHGQTVPGDSNRIESQPDGPVKESLRVSISGVVLDERGAPVGDAEVLDLGFGRGDAMRYCLQRGARKVTGVDFAEAAVELARESLTDYPPEQYELIHDDMLTSLQSEKPRGPWDHILMIDSIEHIQRFEVETILPLIFRILRPGGCFVVHTPFYPEDNDVFEHGGKEACADLTDEFEQTHGMHINRYSKESLARHLEAHGFMRWTNYIFLRPRLLRPIWAYRGPIRWPLARFCGYKVG